MLSSSSTPVNRRQRGHGGTGDGRIIFVRGQSSVGSSCPAATGRRSACPSIRRGPARAGTHDSDRPVSAAASHHHAGSAFGRRDTSTALKVPHRTINSTPNQSKEIVSANASGRSRAPATSGLRFAPARAMVSRRLSDESVGGVSRRERDGNCDASCRQNRRRSDQWPRARSVSR